MFLLRVSTVFFKGGEARTLDTNIVHKLKECDQFVICWEDTKIVF